MAAVLDYMVRPERFLPALVALLVMQAIIVAGVPERVATVGGYRGPLKIFRFDQAMFQTPYFASDLKAYGEQGRQQVVLGHVLWDIATPLLYALGLAGLIGFLAPHTGAAAPLFLILRWVPIAAGAIDLLENAAISWICLSYPKYGPGLIATGLLTHLKWILVASAVAIAGIAMVVAMLRHYAGQR
jgi:hypothetical protein